MTDQTPPSCNTCHKLHGELSTSLKKCAKCQTTFYCSRECQKEDWRTHKRVCAPQAASTSQGSSTAPPPSASSFSTGRHNPGFGFASALVGNDLHTLPEKKIFYCLIDCFRMRMEDEYVFAAKVKGIYGGGDPLPEFRKFLDLAESRSGLLPGWWSREKRAECERVALQPMMGREAAEGSIRSATEKADIVEHYGDPTVPMKLRVLGEKIYGKGFI